MWYYIQRKKRLCCSVHLLFLFKLFDPPTQVRVRKYTGKKLSLYWCQIEIFVFRHLRPATGNTDKGTIGNLNLSPIHCTRLFIRWCISVQFPIAPLPQGWKNESKFEICQCFVIWWTTTCLTWFAEWKLFLVAQAIFMYILKRKVNLSSIQFVQGD